MLKPIETLRANTLIDMPAWDLWHGWKKEEYCGLLYAGDASHVARKKAAAEHYKDARRRWSSEEVHQAVTSLASLPRELLNIIVDLLDRESEISLRLTCRYLYFGCGNSPFFSLTCRTRVETDPALRSTLRFFSEYFPGFHHIPPRKLYCCSCQVPHFRTLFRKEDIIKLPSKRVCLGQLRRLWITSSWSLSFRDLKNMRYNGESELTKPSGNTALVFGIEGLPVSTDRVRNHCEPQVEAAEPVSLSLPGSSPLYIHMRFTKTPDSGDLCYQKSAGAGYKGTESAWCIRYFWSLCIGLSLAREPCSSGSSEELLRSAVKFCPHLPIDNGAVARVISSFHTAAASRKSRNQTLTCSKCKTKVFFFRTTGKCCMAVEVTRYLGPLRSAGEAQWLAHLS